jgi:hypothetical protein
MHGIFVSAADDPRLRDYLSHDPFEENAPDLFNILRTQFIGAHCPEWNGRQVEVGRGQALH